MPKGVEHNAIWTFLNSPLGVKTSPMPKGVEHPKLLPEGETP